MTSSSVRPGWRVLKGSNSQPPRGTRLMRHPEDEARSFQVWEGVEGWKRGYTLVRAWGESANRRCFTMIALSPEDMPIATAKGIEDDVVWNNILAALKLAGVMPEHEKI